MKNKFSKTNLPLIDSVIHGSCSPRENWQLMRCMRMTEGLTHQPDIEIMLLRRGAMQGDAWSMCQLARECYDRAYQKRRQFAGDNAVSSGLFAEAVSWWVRACRLGDGGATSDVASYPIYDCIKAFDSGESFYQNVEMKCALLTEYFLTDLGRTDWNSLPDSEKIARMQRLNSESAPIVGVGVPKLSFTPNLSFRDSTVDGLAGWDRLIQIRYELLGWFERLIQVYFHELGHMVLFDMWNATTAEEKRLLSMYELTAERAKQWQANLMDGDLPAGEKDPDTLSYGVFTAWGVLFAPLG